MLQQSFPSRARQSQGFTLVELMAVMVVIGVLATFAVPGITGMVNNSRLSGQASELAATLQLARSEAVRRNVPVEVCVSSNGTSCGSGTSWAGWIVHGPDPGNGGADEPIRTDTVNGSVQVTSTVARLVFKPSGQIDAEQTLTVCIPTTQPNMNQRVLTVMVSGVVASKSYDGSGACPT